MNPRFLAAGTSLLLTQGIATGSFIAGARANRAPPADGSSLTTVAGARIVVLEDRALTPVAANAELGY